GEPERVCFARGTVMREDGVSVRMVGTFQDITQQVRSAEAVRRSEHHLRAAQQVAHIGSWDLDLESGHLWWSDEVFRIFEIDPEQFGASYEAFLQIAHPEDRTMLDQAYTRHIEENTPYDIQHRLLFADGRIKYVHERCESERDAQGKALRSLGTVQDVTERVLTDEEKDRQREKMEHVQRLESLGVLAGGIAHDFNNLLTAIMGHAALARQQTGPMDSVRESLSSIEQASRRAADLCKQMLAYSGKGKFVVQPINLSELVREMTRLLQVSIGNGVSLRHELADGVPAVEADVAQMQQVIMNLVINASEAIGEGGGIVVIATGVMQVDAEYLHTVYVEEESLEPGRYVYLEVTDNGCGMDETTRKHLFEPFFTTKFTGRGLGMSAIIGIIRGHKGAIKVYSESGKGTTFKVLFPEVAGAAVSLGSPAVQQSIPQGSGTVLVVDDEDSIRTVACLMLESAGYKTMQAVDGVEAVDQLRRHTAEIDCVLLDMTMPRMGGEEAFTEMRRIKPDIKVLLSSGYNQQTATQRFTGKGLAGFVQKPYTPDVLLAAMLKVFEAK
ncbi:MAG: response regulator, partial [Mariprofundaceae bacterium]|nr:response regulator [Mariprofundaceae bacterium]